jgi:hypothetical protein
MNKKTIKKSLIACILMSILLASPLLSSSKVQTTQEPSANTIGGTTLLMGTIINPQEEEGIWTAKAFQVFYYEPGILFSQAGVVKRLTTITFSDSPFLQVWTPGPFELIGYVFGIASDFEIIED